jgi:hypothetical protein
MFFYKIAQNEHSPWLNWVKALFSLITLCPQHHHYPTSSQLGIPPLHTASPLPNVKTIRNTTLALKIKLKAINFFLPNSVLLWGKNKKVCLIPSSHPHPECNWSTQLTFHPDQVPSFPPPTCCTRNPGENSPIHFRFVTNEHLIASASAVCLVWWPFSQLMMI